VSELQVDDLQHAARDAIPIARTGSGDPLLHQHDILLG